MRNLRIYLIIIVSALTFSLYLPKIVKDFLATPSSVQNIYYSPVTKDFIKVNVDKKNKKIKYTNFDESVEYTLDEYKKKRPFTFYYDLVKTKNFPEGFSQFQRNVNLIRSQKSHIKVNPGIINTKLVNLYPLLESNPKYSSLTLPDELFTLNKNSITFINTISNEENKEKTTFITNRLKEIGAKFPLKEAFGTPSTAKPFDEGYFLLDSNNFLFHMKQINNKIMLKKVDTKGVKTKFLLVKENYHKQFYGLLVSQSKDVYLLTYNNYKLIKLPVKDFDYNSKSLMLSSTPYNKIITLKSYDFESNEKVIEKIVMDLNYNTIKSKELKYKIDNGELYENISSLLLPFKLRFKKTENGIYTLKFYDISKISYILYFIIAILLLVYYIYTKQSLKNKIYPLVLISIGGVYTILALFLFNKLNIEKGKK
ncbi:DUF4857 domain-containing protein [Arcobacter sp. CECT 8985]|uniref:DUF4857 domain-containing protein n=1 Tax=Arcobacter sp. CECT 8985 TaxID=1935424 RepID=UPI00100BDDCF|nr:DUF4857 domain-containing protein [Arcobacter sp. CECT 8985]RXJ86851.1 hypothetical protein CRU93_06515 [Arcobacter sp. CECT 8985]